MVSQQLFRDFGFYILLEYEEYCHKTTTFIIKKIACFFPKTLILNFSSLVDFVNGVTIQQST